MRNASCTLRNFEAHRGDRAPRAPGARRVSLAERSRTPAAGNPRNARCTASASSRVNCRRSTAVIGWVRASLAPLWSLATPGLFKGCIHPRSVVPVGMALPCDENTQPLNTDPTAGLQLRPASSLAGGPSTLCSRHQRDLERVTGPCGQVCGPATGVPRGDEPLDPPAWRPGCESRAVRQAAGSVTTGE
jgi:hypothetical protein